MTPEPDLPRYLQLLWGREPEGRRGPKPGRSITDIGAAAVSIADDRGLESVSMKAVAEALGLTTMSLYRYLDSKEQLYLVMLDVAYGPPPPGLTTRGGWRTRLERWAGALADTVTAHPWSVSVPTHEPPSTPNLLRWTDAGVGAFSGTRLTGQQKLSSLLVVDGYVRQHVAMSVQFGLVGGDAGAPRDGTEGFGARMLHLLDTEHFPSLLAVAPALQDDDADFYGAELAFGLRIVLDGVAALVARS
ncbi:MAG: TetR/AcrR family transcriptional regulator [Lapillicoccus sp.]